VRDEEVHLQRDAHGGISIHSLTNVEDRRAAAYTQRQATLIVHPYSQKAAGIESLGEQEVTQA
jgi:hypothetical protein